MGQVVPYERFQQKLLVKRLEEFLTSLEECDMELNDQNTALYEARKNGLPVSEEFMKTMHETRLEYHHLTIQAVQFMYLLENLDVRSDSNNPTGD